METENNINMGFGIQKKKRNWYKTGFYFFIIIILLIGAYMGFVAIAKNYYSSGYETGFKDLVMQINKDGNIPIINNTNGIDYINIRNICNNLK